MVWPHRTIGIRGQTSAATLTNVHSFKGSTHRRHGGSRRGGLHNWVVERRILRLPSSELPFGIAELCLDSSKLIDGRQVAEGRGNNWDNRTRRIQRRATERFLW